uniref:Uncharacterized protein n=1 Tax=Vespula pensylvanica TaxID=30213 RepID=A0A834UD06_VESPE|nr:hypothetical protein H0235_004944 [Vespula pensylvanica]
MNGQELGLLMPAVSWWPRQAVWDNWLPRNVPETTTTTTMTTMTTMTTAATNIRCFDAKLDVTPESNGTSTSEHTSMAAKTQAPSPADLYPSLSPRENESTTKMCGLNWTHCLFTIKSSQLDLLIYQEVRKLCQLPGQFSSPVIISNY